MIYSAVYILAGLDEANVDGGLNEDLTDSSYTCLSGRGLNESTSSVGFATTSNYL